MNSLGVDPEEDEEEYEISNLAYDEEKGTYINDVNDNDEDWDHPANYSTISIGATNDDSSYDVSNPYVGSEYADIDELNDENLENEGMHITNIKNLKTPRIDKELARDEEDLRTDLDEEGYPKRDD